MVSEARALWSHGIAPRQAVHAEVATEGRSVEDVALATPHGLLEHLEFRLREGNGSYENEIKNKIKIKNKNKNKNKNENENTDKNKENKKNKDKKRGEGQNTR